VREKVNLLFRAFILFMEMCSEKYLKKTKSFALKIPKMNLLFQNLVMLKVIMKKYEKCWFGC